jgi:predicted  nucleic acid-binding Zn-ribbon protein
MEENKELSVKANIEALSQSIHSLQLLTRDYKKLIEGSKTEVTSMESKIALLIQDTPKSFQPQIDELFSDLRSDVQNQKNMNEFLQKQITELKKESSVVAQHIIAQNASVSILQDKVGYSSRYA